MSILADFQKPVWDFFISALNSAPASEDMTFLFGLEDLDMFSGRSLPREEKSLINTFPFNQEQESHHHAGDHAMFHQENHHHHAEHAKLQHNSIFPFKAAEDMDEVEDTTDSAASIVTIDAFQEEDMEVGSVDSNSVSGTGETDEDISTGRKCVDKVSYFYCSSSLLC